MICVSIFTDNTHLKHQMDEGSEFFAIVYVIEMVMKIINDGFRKVF
jgi:hypothetical protein